MNFNCRVIRTKKVSRYVFALTSAMLILLQTAQMGVFATLADSQAKIDTGWTDTGKITVNIDTTKNRTAISPYIYGLCADGSLTGVTVNAAKQSGAAMSSYNWENNFSNSGIAGNNTNDYALIKGYVGASLNSPALHAENLVSKTNKFGIQTRYLTLQMMGYAASDGNGKVTSFDSISDRFDKISFDNPEGYSTQPDLNDGSVYIDEYVSYLVNKYGHASSGGINGYFLDYEPENWRNNYPVLDLPVLTPKVLVEKSAELARSVKNIDKSALVLGPSVNGLESFVNLSNPNEWKNYSNSYSWFIDYYLDKMSAASDEAGTRLLDVLDLHFISEAKDSLMEPVVESNTIFSNAARMQATRILWDASYTENSFSAIQYKQNTPIIPTIQASIRMYYPNTKLSFSEYNFGGGKHISGAIAEADALGIFASQGVYMACLLPNTTEYSYQKSAINMYTNYDGVGGTFGNTLVKSDNGGDNMSSVYTAINNNNASTLKSILINKNDTLEKNVKVKITSDMLYSSASVYCLNGDSSDIRLIEQIDDIENNTFDYVMEPLSIYLLEFNCDDTIIDTPNVTTDARVTDISSNDSIQHSNAISSEIITNIPASSADSEINSDTLSDAVTEVISDTQNSSLTSGGSNMQTETDEHGDLIEIIPNDDSSSGVPFAVKIIIGVLVAAVFFGMGYVLVYDKK